MNKKFEILNSSIQNAANKNAPFRPLTKRERNAGYKPWFNKNLTDRVNERKHLYFLIQRRNRTDLINQYETLKKSLEIDLKKAQKDYFDAEFLKHKNDVKETWKLINKVINRKKNKVTLIKKMKCVNGDYVTNQEQICNILNNHFVSNGPNLAKMIPLTNISAKHFLGNSISNSIFMHPTVIAEIENLIDKLKIGKACGPDRIRASFVKHGKKVIAGILTTLINECISCEIFPECLKKGFCGDNP